MKNSDSNTRRDGEEPQAPQKLVAALKEPTSRRVFVPPAVDAAVLNAARRHLARPQRTGNGARNSFRELLAWMRARGMNSAPRPFRSWLVWPAAAGACIALAGLAYFIVRQSDGSLEFAREDVNRDGQVDVLDAFQFARELQAGMKPGPGLDLNGDGVVDGRDAELIATHAVKLEKGGKS